MPTIWHACRALLLALALVYTGAAANAQAFNIDREADAFIAHVAKASAADQHALRTLVDSQFTSFALATTTKKSIYSTPGKGLVIGSVGPEDRIDAAKVLASKLRTRDTEQNQGLNMLKQMVEELARRQR
jgi:hypothetical protein